MAEIFRAVVRGARGFQKTVVIKRILSELAESPEFVELFVSEAQVMVGLAHPKIVQVLDFGEVDGRYFIAMEHVDGVDGLGFLRRCAQQRCRPGTGLAVHLVAEMLDALDYAHTLCDETGRGLHVVHRDISPSNIFISRNGEVKLGDFGIAQAAGAESGPSNMRGKYGYMSPEQVTGRAVDARADIFAAGIVLAEMLMVRRLFLADSDVEVLLQVRDARLDRLERYGKRIPDDLREIVVGALARDPSLRYQSAADFRDALQRYLFDSRRMVRTSDVRLFLARIGIVPRPRGDTGPPQPAVAASRGSLSLIQQAVGHKRQIRVGPPQPTALPIYGTSEEVRIGTEDAMAALTETTTMPSGSEFRPRMPSTLEPPQVVSLGDQALLEESERTTPVVGLPDLPAPDFRGRLAAEGDQSITRLLFKLASEEETGLLLLEQGEEVKEIYLVNGDPQSVVSNRGDELFGQYLLRKNIISRGELSMALAMLHHFDGKLGDTLVALRLMRPVEVIRHLTYQVRQKLLEVFRWPDGGYCYYRSQLSERESAPLGLDAFELLGAGVKQLPVEMVMERLRPLMDRQISPVVPAPVPPEVFRLGRLPRQAYEKLTGLNTLAYAIGLFDDSDARDDFVRMVYLLVETGLLA